MCVKSIKRTYTSTHSVRDQVLLVFHPMEVRYSSRLYLQRFLEIYQRNREIWNFYNRIYVSNTPMIRLLEI